MAIRLKTKQKQKIPTNRMSNFFQENIGRYPKKNSQIYFNGALPNNREFSVVLEELLDTKF